MKFDTLVGPAYHGIASSAATVTALFNQYGTTVNYCYDRKIPDSRCRTFCGHTPEGRKRIAIIDDVMTTTKTLEQRIDRLKTIVDITVVAVIVVIKRRKFLQKYS